MGNKAKTKNEFAEFGGMIRQRRRKLGMSAEALAEKANRSDKEVLNIERGEKEPKPGTTLRICEACNIDVGELKYYIPRTEIDDEE